MSMNRLMNINPAHYKLPVSLVIIFLQTIVHTYTKFMRDNGLARAGSMAYSTLLAAVPLAALGISLMNSFGILDSAQTKLTEFIVQLMIPTRQAEATALLEQFLENSGKLGVVGLVFFTISSVFLLDSISSNLNAIWGSKPKNNFFSKFTTYTSVIIFGTLLITVSLTLSKGINPWIFDKAKALTRVFISISPFVFNFMIISMLIILTPSAKVKPSSAAIAAVLGSIAWEIMKFGFVNISSWALRASVIYGTIAIVPVFLFWLYILWIIIIAAMELTWLHQHRNKPWTRQEPSEMQPAEKAAFGLEVFVFIAEKFDEGGEAPDINELAIKFAVSTEDIKTVTDLLITSNLLITTGEDSEALVPSRSLTSMDVEDVVKVLFGEIQFRNVYNREAARVIQRILYTGIDQVSSLNMSDLLIQKKPGQKTGLSASESDD